MPIAVSVDAEKAASGVCEPVGEVGSETGSREEMMIAVGISCELKSDRVRRASQSRDVSRNARVVVRQYPASLGRNFSLARPH